MHKPLTSLLLLASLAFSAPGDTVAVDTTAPEFNRITATGKTFYAYRKIHSATTAPSDTTFLHVGPSWRYTTIDAAIAAATARNKPVVIELDPAGTYTSAGGTFPVLPIIVRGNNATVTLASAITVTGTYVAENLNVVGNVIYAGASTDRYYLKGGTEIGNITLTSGTLHDEGRTLMGGTITVNGGVFEAITVVCTSFLIHHGGAVFVQNMNFNAAKSTALIVSDASAVTSAFQMQGGSVTNLGTGKALDFSANTQPMRAANAFVNVAFKAATHAIVSMGASNYIISNCDTSLVTDIVSGGASPNWGGNSSTAFRAVTATKDTVKSADNTLGLSGAVADTIQLIAMPTGKMFRLKRTDSNTAAHLILGTIDGSSSYIFSWPWEAVEIVATSSSTFAIVGGR